MNYDKPGCFGNAITYSDKSKACTACDANQSCALAARQRIEELRALISVDSIVKMSHSAPQKLSSRLPDHAQQAIAKMNSRQRKTVGILMTLQCPTPLILVQALVQRLELPKDEAIVTAKETVNLLVKDHLADIEDGRIILRY